MKSFNEFVAQAGAMGLRLRANTGESELHSSDADALFHTPLLALTMLLIAKTKRDGLLTNELATWTGAVLAVRFEHAPSLQWGAKWSLPLRSRCADALVFLENVGLVSVEHALRRTIKVSDSGNILIQRLARSGNEVGLLTRSLLRAYSRAQAKGLQLL
ncbi:hypothetical protein [Corallococcus sp. 4LFB]|uniref:hypothetical protein n=1 Tax=Corallococcus sp. 4LFB TaxID=3383249 RepID=UPI00397554A7